MIPLSLLYIQREKEIILLLMTRKKPVVLVSGQSQEVLGIVDR